MPAHHHARDQLLEPCLSAPHPCGTHPAPPPPFPTSRSLRPASPASAPTTASTPPATPAWGQPPPWRPPQRTAARSRHASQMGSPLPRPARALCPTASTPLLKPAQLPRMGPPRILMLLSAPCPKTLGRSHPQQGAVTASAQFLEVRLIARAHHQNSCSSIAASHLCFTSNSVCQGLSLCFVAPLCVLRPHPVSRLRCKLWHFWSLVVFQ